MSISQSEIDMMFQSDEIEPSWNDRAITIVAPKAWGKTTLLSQLPGMFLVETDYRGADCVNSCPVQRCFRWDYMPVQRKGESTASYEQRKSLEIKQGKVGFLQIVEGLIKRNGRGKIVGVDTVTALYKSMVTDFCVKEGIRTMPDDYGRSYDFLNRVFSDTFRSLQEAGYGLIWTAHVKEDKFNTRSESLSKLVPNMPKGAWDVLCPASDMIFYGQIEEVKGKDGRRKSVRMLTSELMETYFDSGGRFVIDEPFESTAENYISKITEAIQRKLAEIKAKKGKPNAAA